MTTSISQATGIEAGALDGLLGDGIRTRAIPAAAPIGATVAAPVVASLVAPAAELELSVASALGSLAGGVDAARRVDSNPDDATFARHFALSVRTAAPLLAADLASLAAAGLFAQLTLALLHLNVAATLGRAAPVALLAMAAGYWMAGLYSEVWIHPALELRQLVQTTTLALFAAAMAALTAPALTIWCLSAWAAAVVLTPLARALARKCCAGQSWWGFPTLVIGSGGGADRTARMLMRSRACGLRPVLVTDPDGDCRASIVPVMNDPAVLRSIVRSKGVRHAVLCTSDFSAAKVTRAFDEYGELASHLLVVCDTPPLPALWGAQRVCGLGAMEVRNGLLLAPLRAAKRATDVAIALIALTVGMPLFALIALLVKLSGPGGVLFGHRRLGRGGRPFTAWKFRTMHRGADVLLRQHFERFPWARLEWERDQKLREDPRVTRVGRFLRQFSLDELPQMWNVLRGDMSVVGPRPIVDDEVARYGESFERYAGVKPGITGLWQVSGRTDLGYEMRVKLDEFYVRHWSPWLDAYVIARTVVALLCRRGAY